MGIYVLPKILGHPTKSRFKGSTKIKRDMDLIDFNGNIFVESDSFVYYFKRNKQLQDHQKGESSKTLRVISLALIIVGTIREKQTFQGPKR